MLKLEVISLLSIYIFPDVWNTLFDKHLNVVVFPAPFIPNNPKHSPYSRQKDIFLTAFVDLKYLIHVSKQQRQLEIYLYV